MDTSAYVGRCILFKLLDCSIVINTKLETVYKELYDYYHLCKDFGIARKSKIYIHIQRRSDLDEALYDLRKIYVDLIREEINFHSLKNLRLMFIATKFFLIIYKDDPIISAQIVFQF